VQLYCGGLLRKVMTAMMENDHALVSEVSRMDNADGGCTNSSATLTASLVLAVP
jgi:hypothetical protein